MRVFNTCFFCPTLNAFVSTQRRILSLFHNYTMNTRCLCLCAAYYTADQVTTFLIFGNGFCRTVAALLRYTCSTASLVVHAALRLLSPPAFHCCLFTTLSSLAVIANLTSPFLAPIVCLPALMVCTNNSYHNTSTMAHLINAQTLHAS